LEENLKALHEYGKELVGQQHSADLAIQQTRVLAAANLEGSDAVRAATVSNAILVKAERSSVGRVVRDLIRFHPGAVRDSKAGREFFESPISQAGTQLTGEAAGYVS
jgi:hypothetical protein